MLIIICLLLFHELAIFLGGSLDGPGYGDREDTNLRCLAD